MKVLQILQFVGLIAERIMFWKKSNNTSNIEHMDQNNNTSNIEHMEQNNNTSNKERKEESKNGK